MGKATGVPVAIVYNGIPHVVMMATPADLEDFALGFSLTEELIQSPADLEHMEVVRYSRGVEIQATVAQRCADFIGRSARLNFDAKEKRVGLHSQVARKRHNRRKSPKDDATPAGVKSPGHFACFRFSWG